MLKYVVWTLYLFSVFYCFLQLNALIDKCVSQFKERHVLIPMDEPTGWNGLKLTIELLLISSVPVFNVGLGWFCGTIDDSVITEIVRNVEVDHWQEIKQAEQEITSAIEEIEE